MTCAWSMSQSQRSMNEHKENYSLLIERSLAKFKAVPNKGLPFSFTYSNFSHY